MVVVGCVVALIVGVLVGLFATKIRTRWCPTCGAMLTCPDPTYHVDAPRDRRFGHESTRNAAPAAARNAEGPRRNALRRASPGAATGWREPMV